MVTVATRGGNLVEGVVGSPRFINPLLAVSDPDRDLTALVYSGLMRVGPKGDLIKDLAESYEVSDDGRTYTFLLRKKLTFHDGKPLTAADVEFTILKAQDPLIKSVRRASWEGVKVEKVNEREIRFHLKQPYANFLENLTIGILPKHLWQDVSSDAFSLTRENIEPIGSGPFKISKTKFDGDGLPVWYELTAFNNFALGKARLSSIKLNFYPNESDRENAFTRGEIESLAAASPDFVSKLAQNNYQVTLAPLPRIFAVFFNQNEAAIFTAPEVRRALDLAVNKEAIIKTVLAGYGQVIAGPLPPGTFGYQDSVKSKTFDPAAAASLLTKNGWTKNAQGIWVKTSKKDSKVLAFSLATPSTPELKAAAELVAKDWQKFGAQVELKVFELGDLNQNLIRPRKFEALFFGEVVGRDPDPFAFWHSSQRIDPGLNVASYASLTVDKLLAEIRVSTNEESRLKKLLSFQEEIKQDQPASFLYAPQFIYLTPSKIQGLNLPVVVTPADRFSSVYLWYVKTEKIWSIFAFKKNLI